MALQDALAPGAMAVRLARVVPPAQMELLLPALQGPGVLSVLLGRPDLDHSRLSRVLTAVSRGLARLDAAARASAPRATPPGSPPVALADRLRAVWPPELLSELLRTNVRALAPNPRAAPVSSTAESLSQRLDRLLALLPPGVLAGTDRAPWAEMLAHPDRTVRTVALRVTGLLFAPGPVGPSPAAPTGPLPGNDPLLGARAPLGATARPALARPRRRTV